MKLKDVLTNFLKVSTRIRTARMNVGLCKECEEGTTQHNHHENHMREALDLMEKLPRCVGGSENWGKTEPRIIPKINLTISDKGHITADLMDVEIY